MAHRSVVQEWVSHLPMMQQSVLFTAIRGPDGIPKYSVVKYLLRWYRRCVLYSAIHGVILTDPIDQRGQSFTGPSLGEKGWSGLLGQEGDWEEGMDRIVTEYLRSLDEMPLHFHLHLMHGSEIIGYHHPIPLVSNWWHKCYVRLVHDMHLFPEAQDQMDDRLSDGEEAWRARADIATQD